MSNPFSNDKIPKEQPGDDTSYIGWVLGALTLIIISAGLIMKSSQKLPS